MIVRSAEYKPGLLGIRSRRWNLRPAIDIIRPDEAVSVMSLEAHGFFQFDFANNTGDCT